MTDHTTPGPLRRAAHWSAVHVRRHVAFATYATASLGYMTWVVWELTHI
jgi:hypothetical protein